MLDPGNYGPLTITGPVNIQGHGWASSAATTGATVSLSTPARMTRSVYAEFCSMGSAVRAASAFSSTRGGA